MYHTQCKTRSYSTSIYIILKIIYRPIHNIIELRIYNQSNNYQDWIQRIVYFTYLNEGLTVRDYVGYSLL